jgi:uncharacterized protein
VEVIQEFVHVHARRDRREIAIARGRDYVRLLSPLRAVGQEHLDAAFALMAAHPALGAFDAVLAAVVMGSGSDVLVSADRGFGTVPALRWVDPADAAALNALLEGATPPAT